MTALATKKGPPPVTAEWHDVAPVSYERAEDPKKAKRLGRLTYQFKTAGSVNGNMRVYPTDVIKPAIAEFNENKCKRGRAPGRNDHPDLWSPNARIPTIDDAAVRTISAEMVSDTEVKVVIDILRNPRGQHLMSFIENGGNPGISQRCLAVFEMATAPEKVLYGAGEDAPLEICRVLRLVTFDVVSQPGFDDADEPSVTESAQCKDEPMSFKNVNELRVALPELAGQLIAEGKSSVDVKKIETLAVEAARPAIIEEATKPLKDELAAERAKNTKLTAFADSCKTQLLAAGIAVEQVSDVELKRRLDAEAGKVADLTTKAADLAAQLKTAQESLAATSAKLTEAEKVGKRAAAQAAVQAKYGKDKHWKHIAEAVKDIEDEKLALEAAAKKAAEIASIVAEAGGQRRTEPTLEGDDTSDGVHGESAEQTENLAMSRRLFGG